MFVLLALFSSPQKEYLPCPWLQGNDHPSGNKDQHIPESYLNQIHGKSTLDCPGIAWGVEQSMSTRCVMRCSGGNW